MALRVESFNLDREAAAAALPSLEPLVERLPEYPPPEEIAASLPDTTGELAEGAVDEYDDGDGAVNFVQAWLIERALAGQLSAATHVGDLTVESEDAQAVIHHGSLTVEGSLDLATNLIVLGDLTVRGRVRDTVEWSRLIVTGTLECTTIWSGGPVWVGGRVKAEVVHLSHHGKIFAGSGLQAELVVGSPEAVGINGEVQARHHVGVEEWRRDPKAALERLATVVVSEAMETRGEFFVPERLLALAEAGERYLRE